MRGKKETRSRKLSQGNQTESLNDGRDRERTTDSRNFRKEDWKLRADWIREEKIRKRFSWQTSLQGNIDWGIKISFDSFNK